jgi:hypothetical protein
MMVPTLDLAYFGGNANGSRGTLDYFSIEDHSMRFSLLKYLGPSKAAQAIVYQTVYQGRTINPISPCGPNCTFSQSFGAPTYKCMDVELKDPQAPWCYALNPANLERLYPNGTCPMKTESNVTDTFYFAANGSNPTSGTNNTAIDDYSDQSDGKLWVLYKYFPQELRQKGWYEPSQFPTTGYRNISFKCELWDSWFDVQRTFVNSEQQFL